MNDRHTAACDGWRQRQPLSGTDLNDFMALRRVCGNPGSRVNQVGGHFVQNERPLLPFIADGVTALIEVGHATLGKPNPDPASRDVRPVTVTASGRARYEELCDRQGIPPYPTSMESR